MSYFGKSVGDGNVPGSRGDKVLLGNLAMHRLEKEGPENWLRRLDYVLRCNEFAHPELDLS